jgi:hypothetical protein
MCIWKLNAENARQWQRTGRCHVINTAQYGANSLFFLLKKQRFQNRWAGPPFSEHPLKWQELWNTTKGYLTTRKEDWYEGYLRWRFKVTQDGETSKGEPVMFPMYA